jgi:hypothetical protein
MQNNVRKCKEKLENARKLKKMLNVRKSKNHSEMKENEGNGTKMTEKKKKKKNKRKCWELQENAML